MEMPSKVDNLALFTKEGEAKQERDPVVGDHIFFRNHVLTIVKQLNRRRFVVRWEKGGKKE